MHSHNPVLVKGQAPEVGAAGWKDYYECICGERYEDASGTVLIPDRPFYTVAHFLYAQQDII